MIMYIKLDLPPPRMPVSTNIVTFLGSGIPRYTPLFATTFHIPGWVPGRIQDMNSSSFVVDFVGCSGLGSSASNTLISCSTRKPQLRTDKGDGQVLSGNKFSVLLVSK